MLLLLSSPCIYLANTKYFLFLLEMDQSKVKKNEDIFVQPLIAIIVDAALMCHSSDFQQIENRVSPNTCPHSQKHVDFWGNEKSFGRHFTVDLPCTHEVISILCNYPCARQ